MESGFLLHQKLNNLKIKAMNLKKSKKADLESKRVLFFEIGIILSLALVFMAFEWRWAENTTPICNFNRQILIEDDITGIYEKKKEIVHPIPKIIMPIEIPDNSTLPVEDITFSIEDGPDVENDLNGINLEIPEIETEDKVVHVFVQQMPEFPGGESALFAYLAKNVHFSLDAIQVGISGTVLVSFVVWKDGSVGDINVVRSQGAGLDEAVVQAVEAMPLWTPGMQNGKKVNVKFHLPVKFKLN